MSKTTEQDETYDWAAADCPPDTYLDDDAVRSMTQLVADGTQAPEMAPTGWAAAATRGGGL